MGVGRAVARAGGTGAGWPPEGAGRLVGVAEAKKTAAGDGCCARSVGVRLGTSVSVAVAEGVEVGGSVGVGLGVSTGVASVPRSSGAVGSTTTTGGSVGGTTSSPGGGSGGSWTGGSMTAPATFRNAIARRPAVMPVVNVTAQMGREKNHAKGGQYSSQVSPASPSSNSRFTWRHSSFRLRWRPGALRARRLAPRALAPRPTAASPQGRPTSARLLQARPR